MYLVHPIRPDGHAERLLLAAVVRRAAYDIAYYRGSRRLKDRRIWEDAHKWMFGTVDWFGDRSERICSSSWPEQFMSFAHVCYLLNVDPIWIRRKTLRLTKKDVRKYDMVDPYGRLH